MSPSKNRSFLLTASMRFQFFPTHSGNAPTQARNIIIMGPQGSGKTTLMNRFTNTYRSYGPPSLFNCEKMMNWDSRDFRIVDVAGDGLSHRTAPYLRKYFDSESIVLFVIDTANDDVNGTLDLLRTHLDNMAAAGVRFLWLIWSQQNSFANSSMASLGEKIRMKYERALEPYQGQILMCSPHLGQYSALQEITGATLKQEMSRFLTDSAKWQPGKKVEHKRYIAEEDMNIGFPSDEETDRFSSERSFPNGPVGALSIHLHQRQLRAAYLVLLDCMKRNLGIFDAAEELKRNNWFVNNNAWRGHRFVFNSFQIDEF
jgi:GTPase SAR1 family protein